ncbi:Fic/DOC family protein [Natroniella sp. ANB-PHB2]|uniref:Fic/DOC family protein n=1 Tax=Natroniella sp. ANB-PHB2 TaxID=3384444 RepID=UPI0038D45831
MTPSSKYGSDNSKYCYPNTDVLINKLNIKDKELLEEADSLYSAQRLLELQAEPIPGDFDLEHLKKIHYYIFQDLYEFAGKIREEDIIKGNTHFAKSQYIVPNAIKLFKELKEENFLLETTINEFAERTSYYMAELNIIHPFRDGNGRCIREFIRCLALKCDYKLKWNSINRGELFNASVKSVFNTEPLSKCIKKAIKS